MAIERHLILQETTLHPSGEWSPAAPGWTVVRVAEGMGYWLQGGGARELQAGDGFVATTASQLVLRASQLGPLRLEFFCVQPEFLNGLITVAEGHQLELAGKNLAAHAIFFAAADPVGQKFSRLIVQPGRENLTMRAALLQLWSQAVAGVLATAPAEDPGHKLQERFRQLVAQMPDAELATRSLAELAEQLHCSERHFSRLFRAEFGVPLRKRQTELRLQRARQLLADANAKVINVAYESGYRHLGLFNAMFKKRFGVTPSEWRQQNLAVPPKNYFKRPGAALVAWLLLVTVLLTPHVHAEPADTPAQAQARAALQAKMAALGDAPAKNPAPAAPLPANPVMAAAAVAAAKKKDSSTNAGPRFKVEKYLVAGNSVLAPASIGHVFTNVPDAFGTNVAFADIRSALGELQMAYRERGFVTVSVALPPQKLTNAEVKIKVTEGRLAAINVKGNNWFSTPNVLRALPSLHTNMLLNSHIFQRELDTANASRDRQIYPVIGPGLEPGTSELTLKVKDTLPLHARVEIANDQCSPGTPDSRVSFNSQYDNLWQLEHQVGVNYSFSPVDYKTHSNYYFDPLDYPLVANYGGYYRMPLGPPEPVQSQVDNSSGTFGYNEITHKFNLPPPTGRPELNFYASRSTSDTGVKYGAISNLVNNPLLTISKQDSGENITLNEGLGGKVSLPLPPLGNLASTLTLGLDFKRYQNTSYNTNTATYTERATNNGSVTITTSSYPSGQTPLYTEVSYFPINFGLNGSLPDPYGSSTFNVQANYNIATIGSLPQLAYTAGHPIITTNGAVVTTNANNSARNNYWTVTGGASREQRLYKDWTALISADGQWASCPLFSNEQYAMGGSSSVRGYQAGEAYGDTGWRVSVEPRTPMVNIGMVDGDIPFWVRASVFMDYGQTHTLQNHPPAFPHQAGEFWGTGASLIGNIGSHMDARLTIAFPLLTAASTSSGNVQVYFGVGAQF
jgi:hemolysin activation/secretion protein/AraC-like DNA-binding protein